MLRFLSLQSHMQLEDDIAKIASKLGYVPQLNGNSLATATAMDVSITGATATARAAGIISQTGQIDYYFFVAGSAGTVTLSLSVVTPFDSKNRANLDAQVQLLDSTGNVMQTINPAGVGASNGLGIAATPVSIAGPGRYYLAVTGMGAGTVYSNYASAGEPC